MRCVCLRKEINPLLALLTGSKRALKTLARVSNSTRKYAFSFSAVSAFFNILVISFFSKQGIKKKKKKKGHFPSRIRSNSTVSTHRDDINAHRDTTLPSPTRIRVLPK